jgi:MipA family protein
MKSQLTGVFQGAQRHVRRAVILAFACIVVTTGSFMTDAAASDVKIGGIVVVAPKYEGSKQYELTGAPLLIPVFSEDDKNNDVFSVRGADDARIRLLEYNGFEVGVLGGLNFGRDQSDGRLLRGLGDIDPGLVAGAFVGYRFGSTLIHASYHEIISDYSAGYMRFAIDHAVRPSSQLTITASAGVTYADDRYMTEYFSISPSQAASSAAKLSVYDADAGFKDAHVGVRAIYDINSRWALIGQASYKRLLGDAADSPIVETSDQFTAIFGATYRFTFK